MEVQTLQFERHCEPVRMTCKGKTKRDMVFISPELASLFVSAPVEDYFPSLGGLGYIQVPTTKCLALDLAVAWAIDWTLVDGKKWQKHFEIAPHLLVDGLDGTQRFEQWARSFENSLDGFTNSPAVGLFPGSKGRGRVKKLVQQPQQAPLSRPARHGEQRLISDFAGRGVQLWFRQLRRLQAIVQSLRAGNCSSSAQAHRLETWVAICNSSGFQQGFRLWWHPIHLHEQFS